MRFYLSHYISGLQMKHVNHNLSSDDVTACHNYFRYKSRVRIVQLVKVLADKPEDLNLIPRTQTVQERSDSISGPVKSIYTR